MRLWHKDLIHVLPRKQLLGQWRECCAAIKNIVEIGSPNHVLANRIMDYDISHFWMYAYNVAEEMRFRGYKVDQMKFCKYFDPDVVWFDESIHMKEIKPVAQEDLFADWHNNQYFVQCFCNLWEKYDCCLISDGEWAKIEEVSMRKRVRIHCAGGGVK